MLKVYDGSRGLVGYSVETLEAYCSGNTICGLCAYPFELVRIKNARGVINPSRYAIVYVSHSHSSEYQKPTLEVVRWVKDDEVEMFKQMTYRELVKMIREDDC
jgi:hypothetical protein